MHLNTPLNGTLKNTLKYDLVVSIVIYQPALDTLTDTINSVINTTLNYKLVLVDNSPAPLDSAFLNDHTNIEYHHNPSNLGFGKAHNQVIKRYIKQCRYFLVLNPDICFEPETLAKLADKMTADPRIGLCIPRIRYPNDEPQYVNKRLPTPWTVFLRPFAKRHPSLNRLFSTLHRYECRDFAFDKSIVCPSISGCMMFFRASVLDELDGFDERYFLYFEDIDLSRRTAERYLTVVFHDCVAYHHWHRGAYLDRRLFMVLIQSARRYFSKFGWFFDIKRRRLNRVRYY